MKMKNKIRLIVLLILAASVLLPGCGNKVDQDTYEYTHIDNLFTQIASDGMPIGDWSPEGMYSPGGTNAVLAGEKPVFTIFVNPLASDHVIDLYTEDFMVIDNHLKNNRAYMKFIKKNKPFFVSFDCMGEEIARVNVDGKADSDSVKSMILEGIGGIREQAQKDNESFSKYLEGHEELKRDEDGVYYFIVDSKHVSDSIEEISKKVNEVGQCCSYTEEDVMNWADSINEMGNVFPIYQIYVDKYGGDPVFGNIKGLSFAYSSRVVFNSVYRYFVPQGDITGADNQISMQYYCSIGNDGQNRIYLSFGGKKTDNDAVTREEIEAELYGFYDELVSLHEAHGIESIGDLTVRGDCSVVASEPNMIFTANMTVPMDERLSGEAFGSILDESSEIIHYSDLYIEAD